MRGNLDVICSGMRMTFADKLHVMVCYIYTKYYELNHDPSTEVKHSFTYSAYLREAHGVVCCRQSPLIFRLG